MVQSNFLDLSRKGEESMIVTIKPSQIKTGMFVILPKNWSERFLSPFKKKEQLIESEEQIQIIRESGYSEVWIDTSRSNHVKEIVYITHPAPAIEPPRKWKSDKNLNQRLKQLIHDQSLEPDAKASAVYQESMAIMSQLFEQPTIQSIIDAKQSIHNMVDLILSEDATTSSLFKIMQHDFYTYTHSVNVGVLAVALAKRLYGTDSNHNMHELGAGFFLHDLGKAKIDPVILNKPGRLDEKEMAIMRAHSSLGFSMLKSANQLSRECALIVMQHHEREDGTGYPRKLIGNQIHDYSRICCITDVFDALTAERSYKKGLSTFDALRIMKEEMIGHFHAEIFEKFVLLFQ